MADEDWNDGKPLGKLDDGSEVVEQHKELSHVEAMQRVSQLQSKLLSDPFLKDLPPDVSLDEVQSQLAVEEGRAISLQLRRFDDEYMSVRVLQGSTVGDLMKVVQNVITRRCMRSGQTVKINWKSVWKSYWLMYNHLKLHDKMAKLSSYGIANHDEITFVKRLRRENRGKRLKKHPSLST